MQSSIQSMTDPTTASPSTNTTTKSRTQILIQSSGAMIVIIVIGIIIFLTLLLIILKTYNRKTHVSRVLGGSRPRKKTPSSTSQANLATSNLSASSASGSFMLPGGLENGLRLPRLELGNLDETDVEQHSTTSGSTVVTIHGSPSPENT